MLISNHRKVLACVVCGRLKSAFQIASRSGSVADVQYVAHQALHANALPVLDMCKQWLAQYMWSQLLSPIRCLGSFQIKTEKTNPWKQGTKLFSGGKTTPEHQGVHVSTTLCGTMSPCIYNALVSWLFRIGRGLHLWSVVWSCSYIASPIQRDEHFNWALGP